MTIRRWMKIIAVIAWICAVVASGPHLGMGIFLATLCTWVGLYSARYPAFVFLILPFGFALLLTPIGVFQPFLVVGSSLASLVGAILGRLGQWLGSRVEVGGSLGTSLPTMSRLPQDGGALLGPTARRFVVVLAFSGLLALYLRGSSIAERLNDPILVQGWSSDGLIAGKRIIPLPGIGPLPSTSTALTNAIANGVEIRPDGRVYGLVRVHHWCGNDPIRYHLARVDLAFLLIYLGDAQPLGGLDPKLRSKLAARPGGRFSAAGWWLDEYLGFQWWCEDAEQLARSRPVTTAGAATGPSPSPAAGPISPPADPTR